MNRRILSAQLRFHEGEPLKVYIDPLGIPTIGVGRNLRDKGISKKESEYLLQNDIDECLDDLNRQFPWFASLSTNRQHVLIDMRFNLGMKGLLGFVNTLKFIADGKYDAAAGNMLASKWADQVGDRAKRLAYMMKNDVDFAAWKK